jgi:hypothetical protein
VQIVSQKVSTRVSPVTVEDGEKLAFGPPVAHLLRWLLDIKHDRDPVFIVISYHALVSIRSVRLDNPNFLLRAFCLLEVWQLDVRYFQRGNQGGRVEKLLLRL